MITFDSFTPIWMTRDRALEELEGSSTLELSLVEESDGRRDRDDDDASRRCLLRASAFARLASRALSSSCISPVVIF